MENLIQTPYGKKKPETLCRAMDALERERDLLDALQAVCDAYGERDSLLMAQVKAALDKAKGGAK